MKPSEPTLEVHKGDRVWVVRQRQAFPMIVLLASPNSHSLALAHVGSPPDRMDLPLLWCAVSGCYVSLFSDVATFIRPPGPLATCDVAPGCPQVGIFDDGSPWALFERARREMGFYS